MLERSGAASAAGRARCRSRSPASSTTTARRSTRSPRPRRSSGALPLAAHGLSLGRAARRRARTRSTTAPPRSSSARSRETGETLGADGRAWRALFEPARRATSTRSSTRCSARVLHLPAAARSCSRASGSRRSSRRAALAEARFRGPRARALFAGLAAHAARPARARRRPRRSGSCSARRRTRSAGPSPRAARRRIADALAGLAPRARAASSRPAREVARSRSCRRRAPSLLDLTPRQVLRARGRPRCPRRYRARARRVPLRARARSRWTTRSPRPSRGARPECARAGTVHLGGTLEEIARGRGGGRRGASSPARPFVLVAQHTLFDPSRAPAGPAHRLGLLPRARTASAGDATAALEAQLERFAPGFRERRPRARGARARARSSATTRTSSAATWAAARTRSARPLFRPVARAVPVGDAAARPLPLLGLDAARRRRARHVRPRSRAAGCARCATVERGAR